MFSRSYRRFSETGDCLKDFPPEKSEIWHRYKNHLGKKSIATYYLTEPREGIVFRPKAVFVARAYG